MTSYLETLKDLRAILKDQNLDGFLVTMNDPFQNEMVPDHFNRIRFLTGFTGSAGLLLITLQDAFFITDGRYTAQAHQEIDTSLFKIIEGGLPSLKKFIKRDLRLGCDAWAITESFY
jgi:Xaa-Pro aminopeptidase